MRSLLGVESELAGVVTFATDEEIDGFDKIVQIAIDAQGALGIPEIILGRHG